MKLDIARFIASFTGESTIFSYGTGTVTTPDYGDLIRGTAT